MADIKLRAPEPEDLGVMLEIENDMSVWEHSNMNTGPYSRFQLKRYIDENTNDIYTDRQQRFMIETIEGNVAGIVDVFEFDVRNNRAEVGIAILPSFRGCGIASSAIRMIEEHCFNFLGIKQLYSYVRNDNKPANLLFRKCGYSEVGILKSWVRFGCEYKDVVIYQKIQ